MLIDYAAITHQGRVRKNNEDAFLVSAMDGEEPLVNQLRRTPKVCQSGLLAAVADGMGGAAAGEIASREGLASIAVYMFGHWGRFPATQATEKGLYKALTGVAECASSSVLRYSDVDRTARGMGSTLTAVVIWNGHAHFVQVGDSRAYLFRGPDLVQLTTDQTLVNEMIASGYLTPEQARTHPQRSMITQALGSPQPVRAELGKVSIRRGDRLLLCSDGLHGELSNDRIEEFMRQNHSPRHTLEMMLEAALEHGGRDNITALLLALDDPGFPLAVGHEGIRVVSIPPVAIDPPPKIGLLSKWRRFLEGKS
ncbi:MAG TPA: protein phosphatase 2C domain-containing protein [Holophaga sp.]|nr:protein phosphatase 2C domain-containing protein [Holophaga sp.]